MSQSRLIDQYMENLLEGRRRECSTIVHGALKEGAPAEDLYFDLLWPAMERVERMYREDHIDTCVEHMATRINRLLVDQVQRDLPRRRTLGKRILICCAEQQAEELGAEMCADLFENEGWDVFFIGGGVPNDEILAMVGKLTPDIMLVYGMTAPGVPATRHLIDLIRDVGVNPTMNIMISGGVFNRTDELWKEINADLFASDPKEAMELATKAEPRVPEVRIPGAPKKRRRRRRPPLLEEMERQSSR